jgi:hypothetical protein
MAFRSHRLRVFPEFVQRGKINTFVVGKVRCAQEEVMFASIQEFRRWPMARCTWGVEVKFTYRDRVRVNEQLVGAICFELLAPSVVILALFWRVGRLIGARVVGGGREAGCTTNKDTCLCPD